MGQNRSNAGHRAWQRRVLLLLMTIGAFWDGLYTPAQQLAAAALAATLLLGLRRAADWARLELLAIGLLTVGLIGSLWAPAAAGLAAHGPAVMGGWLLAMAAGRILREEGLAEEWLARFWATAGTLMAFGGLLAISFTPVHHSGRLASFLGYPIAVGILGLLGLSGTLPDLAAGRWWAALLALGNSLAVLLSGSRGVWAVSVVLLAYLFWAAPGLLRRAARLGLPALLLALVTALWAAPAVAERARWHLGLILVVSILTLTALLWFQQNWWVQGSLGVVGLILLAMAPGWPWLLGRATALPLTEGSSVERLTFLTDGLRLLGDRPLGGGFRAWSALHLQAASYGYYSAEVHSAPLDLGLAFGWAGGIGFLLLLARHFMHLGQGRAWPPFRLVTLAGLGALGLHALVDWDLSYGLFAFPLWFGFGLLWPGERPIRSGPGVTTWVAAATLATAALLGAGDLFTGGAERALAAGDPVGALRRAEVAVAVTPWNDLAHGLLGDAQARLGLEAEAVESLQTARRLGPYEPWYAQLLGRELARQGRSREAAEAYRELVTLWPWQSSIYEEALQGHLDLIIRAQVDGDPQLVADLKASGRAILQRLQTQKEREPAGRPRRPMAVETPTIERARRVLELSHS